MCLCRYARSSTTRHAFRYQTSYANKASYAAQAILALTTHYLGRLHLAYSDGQTEQERDETWRVIEKKDRLLTEEEIFGGGWKHR